MSRILAIDQGTTSTRAVVLDSDGGARVVASRTHRQNYPRPGWVEHDPAELLAHVRACLDAGGEARSVVAVGLANQGESCLAWDAATGEPAGPVIVWQDDRTRPEVERLEADGLAPAVRARSGLPLDPYFSASKLGWLLREVPEVAALHARGRLRLGTTDAFFRDRLAGRFETDPATASRTALMDLTTLEWDPELCAIFGVPIEALPTIASTGGDLGRVPVAGRDAPLLASLVDQQASLYGHGCRAPGEAKVTFGTGAFALTLAGFERPPEGGGVLPTVAWRREGEPAAFALEGGVYCASAAVNFARGLGLFGAFAEIARFEGPSCAAQGIAFVPALAGLAAPHWDRRAKGAWMGLGLDATRADMIRAVLEGVAFRTAEVVAALDARAPVEGAVRIDGGLSANPHFRQVLADALSRSVVATAEGELTASGVGRMAAEQMGVTLPPPRFEGPIPPRPLPEADRATFAAARAAVQAFGARGRRGRG